MKSFTMVWVPKPRAMPAMPAPASSGARSIPSTPRIQMTATNQITTLASDRNTAVSVEILASERRLHWSLRSSTAGARSRTRDAFSRRAGSPRRRMERRISQPTIRFTSQAPSRISATVRGLDTTQSAAPAQPLEPVRS